MSQLTQAWSSQASASTNPYFDSQDDDFNAELHAVDRLYDDCEQSCDCENFSDSESVINYVSDLSIYEKSIIWISRFG